MLPNKGCSFLWGERFLKRIWHLTSCYEYQIVNSASNILKIFANFFI